MSSTSTSFEIIPATRADIPLIRQFILELAEYEKALPGEAPVTERDLAETLFGERPAAEVIIAYMAGQPVGFALFFHNYSTWLGKRGVYLERSEEHTSELQSRRDLVCRLLLEKKKKTH